MRSVVRRENADQAIPFVDVQRITLLEEKSKADVNFATARYERVAG